MKGLEEVLKVLLGLLVVASISAMYYAMCLYPVVILFVGSIPVVGLLGFVSYHVGDKIWDLIKK